MTKEAWIKSLRLRGLEPIFLILEKVDISDVKFIEEKWIYNFRYYNLFNRSHGEPYPIYQNTIIKNPAYIYALVDPTTKEIKYVGKTIKPQQRKYDHFHNLAEYPIDNHKPYFQRKIRNDIIGIKTRSYAYKKQQDLICAEIGDRYIIWDIKKRKKIKQIWKHTYHKISYKGKE